MHPFLEYLQAHYADSPNVVIEDTIAVMVAMRNNDQREKVIIFLESCEDQKERLVIDLQAKIRYPVTDVRNRKYLEHLGKQISNTGLEVKIFPPRTISLRGTLGRDSVSSARTWGEAFFAMEDFIWSMTKVLQLVTFVAHLNVRIPNRAGNEVYRKVLPSRLALLTVCGHLDDASLH